MKGANRQNKEKTGLTNRLFFLSLLVIVSILIIVGAFSLYNHEKRSLFEDKSNDLEAIARLKINELISWKKERLGDATVISKMPLILDIIENNQLKTDSSKVNKIFSDILTLYDYESVIITKTNGDFIYASGSELERFGPISRQKVSSIINQGSVSVTDFYSSDKENIIHYDIVAPVTNNEEKIVGSLVFRIDPEYFLFPFIQSWPTPSRSSETLLLKEDNDSVLFLNELRHMKNTAFTLKIPLTSTNVPAVQAIMGFTGIMHGLDYRGVEVVAFVSPVENTDWFMVSKIDRKELFEELQFKLGAIIFVSLFILLFLSAGIAWLYILRQKNIFKSMLEAREEFRTTLYSIGDAVITTDSRGNIKQMNQVAEQLTGWIENNARGKYIDDVFKIINEETRKPNKGPFHAIINKGKVVGITNHTLLINKSGKEIPISDSGAPIKNKDGVIIGTVIVFRDQTEDRKRQKLTAKRIELLEYSVKNSSKNVLTKTIDEVCELTNSTIGFYYLIEPGDNTIRFRTWSAKNKNDLPKDHKESIDRFFEHNYLWINCMRQKKPVIDNDCKELNIDNEIIPGQLDLLSYFSVPILKSGHVVAVIGTLNKRDIYNEGDIKAAEFLADISWEIFERKRIEESLEEEQRLLSSLINNIPDNIYFKNKDCRFIRINKAKANKMGLKNPEDALGKTDADYFGSEHSKHTHKDEKGIMKTGIPLVNYEEKEDWKDGKITWVSSTKVPLRNLEGTITGIMGISKDITQQKKMEEELIAAKNKAEQSDKLKSAFLANMSHEIRTPLNGILGFTSILLTKEDMTQSEKDHYSEIISKSANGLLRVIDDILDISLIEAGDLLIEIDPFDLKVTLNELNTIYKEQINKLQKDIQLTLHNEDQILLRSDENRVRQILVNLMDNAVKFTENGSIDFGIKEIKVNEIILFVKDTGIGIEDDMYEKIFSRFRQVDMSSTRMKGGNGLGLSIVKNLVEMLGGKIWVESKPDNGSCFIFSLPYEKETEPPRMDGKVAYANSDRQKPLNILLVEDDSISQMYIEEILETINCKLVVAKNGKEALNEIEKKQFDLILMDIGLPDINGLDLVKEIRKTDKKVWIIAQTAFAMYSDEKNALNAGCNDYIPKPIDTIQLLEKIKKLN